MKAFNVHGIGLRFLAYASVLVVVLAVIATSIAYSGLSGHLLKTEQQSLEQSAELSATLFAMNVGGYRRDALILANSPEIKGLLRARMNSGQDPVEGISETEWNRRVGQILEQALESDAAYRQVSLIGLRNNGRELVRVRNDGGSTTILGDELLQSRSGDDVLFEADTLAHGETRIISWEASSSSHHATAIVHATAGVFTPSGRVFAVISLDIDLGTMLAGIERHDPDRPPFYIAANNGQILLGPTQDGTLGTSGRPTIELAEEFPRIDLKMLPAPGQSLSYILTDRQNEERALAIRGVEVDPGRPGSTLSFIYSVPYADLAASVAPYVPQLVRTAVVFVIVALVFAALLSNSVVGPLDRMTDTIAAFAPGKKLTHLPTRRNDQIGVLARSFERLLSSLDARQATLVSEIAERRIAEAETRASEARYKASLDLMRDAHFVSDANGVIQSVNQAGEEMFGYTKSELVGQNVSVLLPIENRVEHDKNIDRYRDTGDANIAGKGRDTGLFAARKDGSIFPVSLLVEKFATDDGEYLTAIVRDIAQKQEIEAENARLRTVVEHATDCIVLTSPDGVIEYVNPQFELEYGYAKEAVLGKKAADIGWHRSAGKVYDELETTISNGGVWSGQLVSESADGSTLEQDVTISPVFDDAEHVVNLVHIARNIGEKNELERQLVQAQKLESIGQLAAGIAHEINTPTQYVGDNTRFIRDAFEDVGVLFTTLTELKASANGTVSVEAIGQAMEKADVEYLQDEVPRALDQSIEGVERVASIVQAMKAFSHPAQDMSPVDLNAAIQSTVTVASNEWKYVATVHTEFDPQLPLVRCMPGQLNQVVLNMIVNAAHAIADALGSESSDKGSITISTRVIDSWAEIRIADTGAGMPEEIRRRVFDPFFTTKEVGKGTGQGLSIAHNVVVEKHGGTIDVDSTPGKGTCFVVRLPIEGPASASDTAVA